MDKVKELAVWDHCPYCGKKVDPIHPPFIAEAVTRRFPVCSRECREATEKYLRADRKYKKFLYGILTVSALIVLITAFVAPNTMAMYLSILPAGIGFLLFPYPITFFETFQSFPIRCTTLLCRILGLVFLLIFGAVFIGIR